MTLTGVKSGDSGISEERQLNLLKTETMFKNEVIKCVKEINNEGAKTNIIDSRTVIDRNGCGLSGRV